LLAVIVADVGVGRVRKTHLDLRERIFAKIADIQVAAAAVVGARPVPN
jgi:hypothetical protein